MLITSTTLNEKLFGKLVRLIWQFWKFHELLKVRKLFWVEINQEFLWMIKFLRVIQHSKIIALLTKHAIFIVNGFFMLKSPQ